GQDQFQVPFDDRQGIVQLVRNPRNHLAERGEFFRLSQLLFKAGALGQLAEEKLERGAPLKTDGRAVHFRWRDSAVAADEVQVAMAADGREPLRAGLWHRL